MRASCAHCPFVDGRRPCWSPYHLKFLKDRLEPPRSVLPFLKTIKMQKPRPRRAIYVENYKHEALSDFIDVFDAYPVEVVFSR